jgi:hypothetical protein
MLMMAVETLIEPARRSDAVRAHVEQLIALTKEADLPNAEKDSVVGSLNWLFDESISQAGRRLAARLGSRNYMGEPRASSSPVATTFVADWSTATIRAQSSGK